MLQTKYIFYIPIIIFTKICDLTKKIHKFETFTTLIKLLNRFVTIDIHIKIMVTLDPNTQFILSL